MDDYCDTSIINMCTANMSSLAYTINYEFSSSMRNIINEMATYECGMILFMISLYWGSKLHPANGIHTQRSSAVQELSSPTWYRETKHVMYSSHPYR